MPTGELAALFEQGRYADCQERAEALLRCGGLDRRGLAFTYLILSQSLSALQAHQEALSHAVLAHHHARDCRDNDLFGRAICHSALVFHENRLHKQAVTRLREYYDYYALYRQARELEGWVLYHLAVFYRAMGRGQRALEYFRKAYGWQLVEGNSAARVEECRASLIWQLLQQGEVEPAERLLAESEQHLARHPEDREGRARLWNNQAYRAFLRGFYQQAMRLASQVVAAPGFSALHRAHACLILHYTARALGKERVAAGMAILARIQAGVARRPDLEEEATRSLVQGLQQQEGLPLLEDLFAELGLRPRQGRGDA